MQLRLATLVCFAAILVAPASMLADTTYTYTGFDFQYVSAPYTTSDSVSGYFTLAAPLAANSTLTQITPLTFDFTDGFDTVTPANFVGGYIYVGTSGGSINQWDIELKETCSACTDGGYNLIESYLFIADAGIGSDGAVYDYNGAGSAGSGGGNGSGTWSVSSAASPAPEPEPLALVGTGLAAAVAGLRRRFDVRG